jgi:hypothetical protein
VRVNILIDLGGRSVKAGSRNIAVAISKLGYIHLRAIDCPLRGGAGLDRTVIVTLQPRLSSELAVVAVGYEIADLKPERTIVIADFANPQCWVFSGYLPAIAKLAALVCDRTGREVSSPTNAPVGLA